MPAAVLSIVIAVCAAPSATAASFPKEIRGTVGGFRTGGGFDTRWSGTIVFKRVSRSG